MAEWFGLPVEPTAAAANVNLELPPGLALPAPGRILLITGPSGAGKSVLLRRLLDEAGQTSSPIRVLDVSRVRLAEVPCVDQLGSDLSLALDLLCRVGLGEAFTCLRLPSELSDGQRWRLRLAVCIRKAISRRSGNEQAKQPVLFIADEFCAVLDRVSAAVVARSLRRTIDRLCRVGLPLSAVVASSHDDLEPALLPDAVARCDFGILEVEVRGET